MTFKVIIWLHSNQHIQKQNSSTQLDENKYYCTRIPYQSNLIVCLFLIFVFHFYVQVSNYKTNRTHFTKNSHIEYFWKNHLFRSYHVPYTKLQNNRLVLGSGPQLICINFSNLEKPFISWNGSREIVLCFHNY